MTLKDEYDEAGEIYAYDHATQKLETGMESDPRYEYLALLN